MYKLSKNLHIPQKLTFLTARRAAASKANDQFHQPDITPEELRLVNERLKIRNALREEYLKKATDPHHTDPYIFDPAIQRYYSMHMTMDERFIPTFKNWCTYMMSIIVPVISLALFFKYDRERLERKYRSGEIEYKDRIYRAC